MEQVHVFVPFVCIRTIKVFLELMTVEILKPRIIIAKLFRFISLRADTFSALLPLRIVFTIKYHINNLAVIKVVTYDSVYST